MMKGIRKRKMRLEQRIQDVRLPVDATTGLKEVAEFSSTVIASAMGNVTPHRFMMGNAVPTQNVLTQLLRQPRLTVDMTIAQLRQERPLGLDLRSLVYLLENNLVVLNVRDDYGEAESKGSARRDSMVQCNLEEIFTCCPHAVYFGSSLRRKIFDSLLHAEGLHYEDFCTQAMRDLAPAHAAFKECTLSGALAKDARFRGELPSLVTVAWHWAFLNAVAGHLDKEYAYVLHPQRHAGQASTLYAATAQRGHDAQKSKAHTTAAAQCFADLAVFLRICHLNFTAPITECFGGTYNMTADEYILAQELARQPLEDEVVVDEEYCGFLMSMLQDTSKNAAVSYQHSALLTDAGLVETMPVAAFRFDQVRVLVDRLLRHRDKITDAYAEISPLTEAFLQGSLTPWAERSPHALRECLERTLAYQSKKNTLFRTLLEAGWKHAVLPLTDVSYGAWTVHMGISPLESGYYWKMLQARLGTAPGSRESRTWRKASHSVLFRVHKQLTVRY